MADRTGIKWTDATWNPIVGCSVVSPGCTNCYAMRQAGHRLDGNPKAPHYAGTTRPSKAGPVWTGKVAQAPERTLTQPLRWRRPRRIFVNSMGDLFHEAVPDEWIDRVFAAMALSPRHTFQVLTKRAERMLAYMEPYSQRRADGVGTAVLALGYDGPLEALRWPLPNVWLGVSVEDQASADARIPVLLATPAAVRWISAEPLLGAVDLTHMVERQSPEHDTWLNALHGGWYSDRQGGTGYAYGPTLDWVVVGGESGPGARPMHPDWALSLCDQCCRAGVPFLFKQWGDWGIGARCDRPDAESRWLDDDTLMSRFGKKAAGRVLDGVTHDAYPEARP